MDLDEVVDTSGLHLTDQVHVGGLQETEVLGQAQGELNPDGRHRVPLPELYADKVGSAITATRSLTEPP